MVLQSIERIIGLAEQFGLFRYVLPFLIVFVIVYGTLDKVQPFGEGNSRMHLLLSILVGVFAVVLSPRGTVGTFLSQFLGASAVVFVAVVGLLAVVGIVFRGRLADYRGTAVKPIAGIAAIAIILLFLALGGLNVLLPDSAIRAGQLRGLVGPVLVLALLGLLVWALTGGGGE